jgi:hypothetical protein
MDRSETVVLTAYAVAGLVVLGCAFAAGRTWVFRLWCVVLGVYVGTWPAWLLRAEDLDMPFAWRVGPLAVPVVLLLVTLPGVIQRRRARAAAALLPEIEDEPEDDHYPAEVPIGQMPPPHDPWRALYDSLARQRAKWEEASGPAPAPVASRVQTDEPDSDHDDPGPPPPPGGGGRPRRPRQYDGRHRQAASGLGATAGTGAGAARTLGRLWRIAHA